MPSGNPWSREELLLALNLYFKLPFGQQDSSNTDIQKLAERLDRTPGAVAMKLNNFAAIDPELDRKGLPNYSQKDKDIWDEYWQDLGRLAAVSEYIYEEVITKEKASRGTEDFLDQATTEYGTEESTRARRRKGQKFFRGVLLTHYKSQCAVCQLKQPSFLDASHIVDWSDVDDPNLRVDPRNGILFCAIHHRAFDAGALRVHPEEYTVQLSDSLQQEETPGARFMFQRFQGEKIFLPERFKPKQAYLERKFG